MKKIIFKSLLILGLLTGFNEISHAQRVFVKVRPVAAVAVRPVAPSRHHVWIDGEWAWQNNRYVYKAGYWAVPRAHRVWVTGHWRRWHGGWNWAPGYWRRH